MRKGLWLGLLMVCGCGGGGSSETVINPLKDAFVGSYSGGWFSDVSHENGDSAFVLKGSKFTATFTNSTIGKNAKISGTYEFTKDYAHLSGTLIYDGSTLKQPFDGVLIKTIQTYTMTATVDDGNNSRKIETPVTFILDKK